MNKYSDAKIYYNNIKAVGYTEERHEEMKRRIKKKLISIKDPFHLRLS